MADAKPVFISYARSTSRAAAVAVHQELGEGQAFLDTDDIDLLDEFPRRLSEGLLGARVVVCLVDAAYFRRWYCLKEWALVLMPWRQEMARRRAEGGTPDLAAALQHVVIALPEAIGREDLLRLPAPLRAQNLPMAARTKELAGLVRAQLAADANRISLRERLDASGVPAAHRDLLTSPHRVPFAPQKLTIPVNREQLRPTLHDRFIGRANEIWQVHDLLNTQRDGGDEAAEPTAALVSTGGFGKSRLAVEYLHRFAPSAYPGGGFWIDASQPDAMDRQFREVLAALQVPVGPEARSDEIRDLLARTLVGLKQRALYVIDNLPEAAPGQSPLPIRHFCPAIDAVACLVTSRVRQDFGGAVSPFDLDVLPADESRLLLMRGVDSKALSQAEQDGIAAWCGHLPLALEVINGGLVSGALLPREAVEFSQASEVAEQLTAEVEALRGQVPEESLRSITQVFDVSLQRLDADARGLAEKVAWLAPAPIPVELLDQLAPRAARTALVMRSLLTPARETKDAFGMHRVLASFLRSKAPGAEAESRRELFSILEGDAERVRHDSDFRRQLELRVPHFDWHVARTDGEGGSAAWLTRSVVPTLQKLTETSADAFAGTLTLRIVRRLCHDADRAADADGWASLQVWHGVVLTTLGKREEGTARLTEAVETYRAALEIYTRERARHHWSMTQNNLGIVFRILGEREEGVARLLEAVAVHRVVLEVNTREREPLIWAATQNNLGNVLHVLGDRTERPGQLKDAVMAFRAALEVTTRERAPHDWATIQDNLGSVLGRLGRREKGTIRLIQAVTAHRSALEILTRECSPLIWAMTQNNLSVALTELGSRENEIVRLTEAVVACRAALEVYSRESMPLDWAGTQSNLAYTLAILGRREAGTARLAESAAAFRAALEVYTRERTPLKWATTQHNLGLLFEALAMTGGSSDGLDMALAAHRQAATVLAHVSAYATSSRQSIDRVQGLLARRGTASAE